MAPVLAFLGLLVEQGIWVEVSTPLIPGFNDDRDAIAGIAGRILSLSDGIPWHLLRFTPEYQMSGCRPTHPDYLRPAVAVARGVGLKYVYVERALGRDARCTFCPGCGAGVVARGLWQTEAVRLSPTGACPSCGASIPGRWRGDH
jgi:pyruvate formate lyase activating enzyme